MWRPAGPWSVKILSVAMPPEAVSPQFGTPHARNNVPQRIPRTVPLCRPAGRRPRARATDFDLPFADELKLDSPGCQRARHGIEHPGHLIGVRTIEDQEGQKRAVAPSAGAAVEIQSVNSRLITWSAF